MSAQLFFRRSRCPYLYSTGACPVGQPSRTKRQALHNGADALDAALQEAIADSGVTGIQFVDVRGIFTGQLLGPKIIAAKTIPPVIQPTAMTLRRPKRWPSHPWVR